MKKIIIETYPTNIDWFVDEEDGAQGMISTHGIECENIEDCKEYAEDDIDEIESKIGDKISNKEDLLLDLEIYYDRFRID